MNTKEILSITEERMIRSVAFRVQNSKFFIVQHRIEPLRMQLSELTCPGLSFLVLSRSDMTSFYLS